MSNITLKIGTDLVENNTKRSRPSFPSPLGTVIKTARWFKFKKAERRLVDAFAAV